MPKDNQTSNLKVDMNGKYENDQIIKIIRGQSIINPQPSYSSRNYNLFRKISCIKIFIMQKAVN